MPITRPRDVVSVEAVDTDTGSFDRFTSVEVTNDLTAPADASFECGDDSSWRSMEDLIRPGSRYRVIVNGKLRLTGRVETDDVTTDAQGGATVRFVVRTKLADAAYASARQDISVQNSSLRDIVLRAYAPHGYTAQDFIFRADVSRDLMTGRSSKKGAKKIDLEPMQLQEAKVKPPETTYAFVERHLIRFHLTHWDSPDGRIVVGTPDDLQDPLYFFNCKKGPAGRENNVLSAHRIKDISDAPSVLTVVGTQWNDDFTATRIARSVTGDPSLAKFYRPVLIVDQSLHTRDQAIGRAMRETVARNKKIDAWEIGIDGWSFWDGKSLTNYGIDTTADINVDTAGGATGAYLVHRVALRLDPDAGFVSQLTLLRRGLWSL